MSISELWLRGFCEYFLLFKFITLSYMPWILLSVIFVWGLIVKKTRVLLWRGGILCMFTIFLEAIIYRIICIDFLIFVGLLLLLYILIHGKVLK